MSTEREAFEAWYAVNAFDYGANPIGSRDCGLQWRAWQAALAQPAPLTDAEIRAIFDAQYAEYGQLCDVLDIQMFARAVLAAQERKL